MKEPSPLAPPTAALSERTTAVLVWMPLISLLVMVMVVAVLLLNVVNCGSSFVLEGSCLLHEPSVQVIAGRTFGELSGRMMWSISVLLFALTITITYAVAGWTIFDALRSDSARHRAYPAGIFVGALVLVGATYRFLPGGQHFGFNEFLLRPTVYAVSRASSFVTSVEFLGTAALFFIAFAASLVLLRARRTRMGVPGHAATDEAAVLAVHQERVRILLYVGALSLVAGTLQATSLYSWAASMLAPKTVMVLEASKTIAYFDKQSDIPGAMGMLNGSFYSILLASIFVPAFAYLSAMALTLAHEAHPKAPAAVRTKWIEENSIGGSLPMQFRTAAALLAPMLAGGPLTSLLEILRR